MAKEKTANVITIDGVEYTEDQLTDHQKTYIAHIASLDQKINSAKFNLDQLSVGREAFMKALKETLDNTTSDEEKAA